MGKKPEAGDDPAKTMASVDKQKAQSARFIEAARENGVDETGKDFDRSLSAVLPIKRTNH